MVITIIIAIIIIVGTTTGYWYYFLKCSDVNKECETHEDCCEGLSCNQGVCISSNKLCSNWHDGVNNVCPSNKKLVPRKIAIKTSLK